MQQRAVAVTGSILLMAGCLTGLFLILATLKARIEGVVSTIVTDAPSQQFKSFHCPFLMGNDETGQVTASIANPIADPIEYSINIVSSGLAVDTASSRQTLTVAGHQTSTLAWKVVAGTPGNQAIIIQATSAKDLALPGPFHAWPTSFRESCGILVIDIPLTGLQMAGLCGLCILVGIALILPTLLQRGRKVKTPEKVGAA